MNGTAGDFEQADNALVDLGVVVRALPGTRTERRRTPRYVLAMDANDMPDFLAATIKDGDARLARTIEAFVAIACGYDGLSDERAPFLPPTKHLGAIRALSRMGYAERVGAQYRWTDLIGPAMRAAFLWNEQLHSDSTIFLAERAAEAEAAWRTMPDTIRQTYFSSRPVNFIAFAKVLSLSWKDGQWHPFKSDATIERSGVFSLAERIIKYADEGS